MSQRIKVGFVILLGCLCFAAGRGAELREELGDSYQYELPKTCPESGCSSDGGVGASGSSTNGATDPTNSTEANSNGEVNQNAQGETTDKAGNSDDTANSGKANEPADPDETADQDEAAEANGADRDENADPSHSANSGETADPDIASNSDQTADPDDTANNSENTNADEGAYNDEPSSEGESDSAPPTESGNGESGNGISTATKARPYDLDLPEWDAPELDWPMPEWETVRFLVWTLIALLLLTLIILLIRRILRSSSDWTQDADEGPTVIDELRGFTEGRQHASWAEEDEFELAIHAMLLDVFLRLQPSMPIILRPAATSREIAEACEGLVAPHVRWLVNAVELGSFAHKPVDRATYERALTEHEAAQQALRGSV